MTTALFDDLNRVMSLSSRGDEGAGTLLYQITYDYDLAGNRRNATETINGIGTRNLTWGYDDLYRLTSESWTGPSAQMRTYEYDAAGNRTSRTINATASGGGQTFTRYWYDALNRLNYSSVSGGDTTNYEYDANGNLIKKYKPGETTRYIYDVSNRLTQVVTGGSNTVIFTAAYDARTRRLGKTESAATTIFRYDGGTNFQERNTSGQIITELVRAGGLGGGIGSILYSDKPMAPTPGPWEGFLYNAVGSTTLVTDSTGTPTQRNMYEAFGKTVVQTGTSTNNRLANTKERDASIGLDNHGFRYYDPESGRYITRDPVGYADGLNVYAHVTNNPINRIDPLGLTAIEVVHNTRPADAAKIVEEGLNAGTDGVRWFNSPESAGVGASGEATAQLKYSLDAQIKDVPNDVVKNAQKAANKALHGSGLTGEQYKAAYGRKSGEAIAEWVKNQGDDALYQLKGPKGSTQYVATKAAWQKASPRLTGIAGEGAETAVKELGKRANQVDDLTKAARTKWGTKVAVAGRIAKFGVIAIQAGIAGYEIYQAEDKLRESAVQGGGLAGSFAVGWAGTKAGAAVGGAVGVWFGGIGAGPGAAIGGFVGGVGGAIGGYWAGKKATGAAYDWAFSKGVADPTSTP